MLFLINGVFIYLAIGLYMTFFWVLANSYVSEGFNNCNLLTRIIAVIAFIIASPILYIKIVINKLRSGK